MERFPEELILYIFGYLSPRELLQCSCVCWRWHQLSEEEAMWKRLYSAMHEKPLNADVVNNLAKQTSWKFAYSCCHLLKNKETPPFWNDTEYYLRIQEKYKKPQIQLQWHHFPSNGFFWIMLQLELKTDGISSPLAKTKPKEDALTFLQKSVLTLSHHYSPVVFLRKLREVAALPSASYFLSEQNCISTSLLIHLLNHGHVDPPHQHHWPPSMSLYLDWEHQFIAPVQDAVLQALKFWADITGMKELQSVIQGEPVIAWLWKLSQEDFWVGHRKSTIKKICSLLATKESTTQAKFQSLFLPEPTLKNLTDISASPKHAALKLSAWSYCNFPKLPRLELMRYFTAEDQESPRLPLSQLMANYWDGLARTVTSTCSSPSYTRKQKTALVLHVIDICKCLKDVNDFMSLKPLLSVVRAVVGQTHFSNLSWKDINIKHCETFKQLEDFMSYRNCYSRYLSYVKHLRKPYVPYLPAHRQYCRQRTLQPSDSDDLVFRSLFQTRSRYSQTDSYLHKCDLHSDIPAANHIIVFSL